MDMEYENPRPVTYKGAPPRQQLLRRLHRRLPVCDSAALQLASKQHELAVTARSLSGSHAAAEREAFACVGSAPAQLQSCRSPDEVYTCAVGSVRAERLQEDVDTVQRPDSGEAAVETRGG